MILSLNTGVSNDDMLLIIRDTYPDVVGASLILLTAVYPRGSDPFPILHHLWEHSASLQLLRSPATRDHDWQPQTVQSLLSCCLLVVHFVSMVIEIHSRHLHTVGSARSNNMASMYTNYMSSLWDHPYPLLPTFECPVHLLGQSAVDLLTMELLAREMGKGLFSRVPNLRFTPLHFSLHHECPVYPRRATIPDFCWEVDYRVDRCCTCRRSFLFVLIV